MKLLKGLLILWLIMSLVGCQQTVIVGQYNLEGYDFESGILEFTETHMITPYETVPYEIKGDRLIFETGEANIDFDGQTLIISVGNESRTYIKIEEISQ